MRSRRLIVLILICLLTACGEDNPPALSEGTPSPAENSSTPRLKVVVSEARAFAYPSRDAEIVFRLIEGDELPILARTESDAIGVIWYQVGQADRFGWIAGSQVEISGDTERLRVVAFQTGTATPLALSPTPVVAVTATPSPADDPVIRVNVPVAVVFQKPERDSEEATRLLQGESADILGKTEANSQGDVFYLIGQNGVVLGWILETQAIAEGNLTTVPVVSIEEALAAVLPAEGTVVQQTTSEPTPTPVPPSATVEITEIAAEPTITVTTIPVTPSASPDLAATAQAAPTATDIPDTESTGEIESTESATEESGTPEPTPVPQIEPGVPPPFTITLPEGWGEAHMLVPISSAYLQGSLPVSLYQGPLGEDTFGFIWLIWAFPNVTTPGSGELNLYADGLQLLRGVIFDSTTCNIGLGSERRQYTVGGYEATGTIYSATDCPDANDTAGFFASLSVEGQNFAFIVGVEPVSATSTGLPQIQAILDSIEFEVLPEDE